MHTKVFEKRMANIFVELARFVGVPRGKERRCTKPVFSRVANIVMDAIEERIMCVWSFSLNWRNF